MQRWRFTQIAGVVVVGLAISVLSIVYFRNDEPLFQRFIVAPGHDPSALPLTVDGANLIEIDRAGALLVHLGPRVKRQPQPRAHQDIDGRRQEVAVRFDIAAAGNPRLVVGPYDRAFPLVIEP